MNTNISKEIADCLKRYLDRAIDRERLNTELIGIRTKMVEAKINMKPENHPYIYIIHWVTIAIPHLAYNDDQIRHVYRVLSGEKGYELQYTYWIPKSNRELNETEQKILTIARKYVDNYNSNTHYTTPHNQEAYLENSDIQFIISMHPDKDKRQEFRKPVEISDFAISQMLSLLESGRLCIHPEFDTNRPVAHKLTRLLSSYENDLPIFCTVTLKNGVTTVTVC
ncbi:MAG: hypothetical protein IKT46_00870 [Clostridia bacterium]|nr:hypothetical protein [Clostridia bacterium]